MGGSGQFTETYARTMKVDYSRFSLGRATWEACSGSLEKKNGNYPSICSSTQENQEKPVLRWPVAGLSGY
jgi:hypothetical protein